MPITGVTGHLHWGAQGCWASGMPVTGHLPHGFGEERSMAETGKDPAQRTSTLSLGDGACRLRVVRTGDPLAPYTDKLHQRFSGEQTTGG